MIDALVLATVIIAWAAIFIALGWLIRDNRPAHLDATIHYLGNFIDDQPPTASQVRLTHAARPPSHATQFRRVRWLQRLDR